MSLVLPLDAWPTADRDMWSALRLQGGPFDDKGALAHLRGISAESLTVRYGRWLEWLRRSEPGVLATPPAERADRERLRAWLASLDGLAPMSRLMFVDGALRVLTAAAPERDWTAQRRILAHLKRTAGRGDPARKRGRILSSVVLLDHGLRLAGPGADDASTPLERARRRRDGAMVAVLAMMPMRCRAFAGLELGRSLIVEPDDLTVALPEHMTKNGRPWDAAVPEPAAGVLRRYLVEARTLLIARGDHRHDVVWVGDDGRPLGTSYLGVKIAGITRKLTGIRVPPHFFRDAAATTLTRASPESARLVRPILAHSGFETAERHYIHASTIEAGRDYASVLKRLRGRR